MYNIQPGGYLFLTLLYAEAGHVASEGRMIVNGGKEEWRKPPSCVNTGLYNFNVGELKTDLYNLSRFYSILQSLLHRMHGGVVVKALRYKPAGHGFDSRWWHWNFSVT